MSKIVPHKKSMKLLIATLVTFAITATSWAQVQEASISSTVAAKIYRSQKQSATCWAACNSMLLAAEGIDSSEQDQIQRMSKYLPTGGLTGAGANFFYASKALSGTYGDRTIQAWYLDRRELTADPSMNKKFVELIQKGKPVMIATLQHGMVAIGVKYRVEPNGYYTLLAFNVNDPNPAVNGSRWLPQQEALAVYGFMAINGKADSSPGGNIDASESGKESLAGTWRGKISQGPFHLTVVFKIKKTVDDYTAKTDSPDEGAYNIKTEITVNEKDVDLEIATPSPASFSGKLKGKTLVGTFSQGGNEFPLTLRK